MQRKLVLWFVLLIVGFLAGFILQYARLQQAQQELSASTKQLGSCQASEQLSQLRDTATSMFLEAVQKNYGKAGEDSKEFFDKAQRIQSSTGDPALRNLLRDTFGHSRSDHCGCGEGRPPCSLRNTGSLVQSRADGEALTKPVLPPQTEGWEDENKSRHFTCESISSLPLPRILGPAVKAG
jgi:type II secretory pathway pseudopilin PulG